MQEAHEEAASLCLIQLVTAGTVAYERLRSCKLTTNKSSITSTICRSPAVLHDTSLAEHLCSMGCVFGYNVPPHTSLFLFLTFSHPSIFSLFLSLLLRFESTLIREPRESVWFPVATAKEEKAAGGGASNNLLTRLFEAHVKTHTATCDGVEDFFGKGGIYRVAMTGDRGHTSPHTEVISRALNYQGQHGG